MLVFSFSDRPKVSFCRVFIRCGQKPKRAPSPGMVRRLKGDLVAQSSPGFRGVAMLFWTEARWEHAWETASFFFYIFSLTFCQATVVSLIFFLKNDQIFDIFDAWETASFFSTSFHLHYVKLLWFLSFFFSWKAIKSSTYFNPKGFRVLGTHVSPPWFHTTCVLQMSKRMNCEIRLLIKKICRASSHSAW